MSKSYQESILGCLYGIWSSVSHDEFAKQAFGFIAVYYFVCAIYRIVKEFK
jgi:hypothetical protein